MRSKVSFLLTALLVGIAIAAASYLTVNLPIWSYLHRPAIDPLRLHLEGEFVESNLGSARQADGSITIRMIAEQYVFAPRCVLAAAGVPVHLRLTSGSAVHKLAISDTSVALEAVPSAVTEASVEFPRPGRYAIRCREFCGAGHYAMSGEVVVVPKSEFPSLQPAERANCAVR